MLLFQLIVLFPILVFGVTITRKVDGVECKVQSWFATHSCTEKLTNLQNALDEWKSRINNMDAVSDSCKKARPCLHQLKCVDENNLDMTRFLDNHCKALIFLAENFGNCYETLETTNTTCIQEWTNIFPGLDETGDVYVPADKQEYCKNFFGSENCLRKEVTIQCGQNMWKELKTALTLNEKNCNFENL